LLATQHRQLHALLDEPSLSFIIGDGFVPLILDLFVLDTFLFCHHFVMFYFINVKKPNDLVELKQCKNLN